MIAQGGMAGPDKPGVNELRIMMGDKQNEAQAELPPGQPNVPMQEDEQRILSNIRTAKQHADLVIVYQHNHVFSNRPFMTLFGDGIMERMAPNEWLQKWVHQEVDAGADIIVMHGAPLLHGIEIYKGKPIFYDLGNFMFNVPPTLTTLEEPIDWTSVVPYVQFQGGKLQSISLQPILMNNVGEGTPDVHSGLTNNQFLDTRGLPAPAKGPVAKDILQRVADLSKPFGTEVVLNGETADVKVAK
jgi:poly-gamma-glutamate synthesis protein (capsule biosynthesis protein)